MKKIFLALTLTIIGSAAFSQSLLNTAKSAASSGTASASSLSSLGNISSLKDAIMSKLTPSLGLTAAQQPVVANDVTGYLKDKSAIMPLANTDKAAYASKSAGLVSGLSGKLKSALTAAQYAKFLGLKPSVPSTSNVLSSLFF